MNKFLSKASLRYRNGVVLTSVQDRKKGLVPDIVILGFQAELASLGYTMSPDLICRVKNMTDSRLSKFRDDLISELKAIAGADHKFIPMFKRFPDEILHDEGFLISRIEILTEYLLGIKTENHRVLSCGHSIDTTRFDLNDFSVCPFCLHKVDELDTNREYPELEDVIQLKIIHLVSKEDAESVFTNFVSSNVPISPEAYELIESFIKKYKDRITGLMPKYISQKEILSFVAGSIIKNTDRAGANLTSMMKTATDVLRLAVAFSDGDVSLAEPTRFKLTNKQKNTILYLLDKLNSRGEDMKRHRMAWIRLGEVIHPGSKRSRFPYAARAFDVLRNNPSEIKTFASATEALIKNINSGEFVLPMLVMHLKKRPGEFARRMDYILTVSNEQNSRRVLWEFERVVDRVSTKVKIAMIGHFKHRDETAPFRYFIPKGNIAKTRFFEGDNRRTIDRDILNSLHSILVKSLMKDFSGRDLGGNVFIDQSLKNYLVPLSERSASKAMKTITRGSKISFDSSFIRFFIWWKNIDGGYYDRVDVDLSAMEYDENWGKKGHVSYTRLSSGSNYHSGDVTDAPNGACEFIDLNIEDSLNRGIRYISMNVLSYTSQPFDSFECFAGFMEREKVNSGEPFEAATVKHRFDISGKTKINVPLIIDLKEKKIIWCDMSIKNNLLTCDNVEKNGVNVTRLAMIAERMEMEMMNLYDLIQINVIANGGFIHSREYDTDVEYDHEFHEDFAIEIDNIMSNFM